MDQQPIDQERVVGGDEEVALWQVFAECAGTDQDRHHLQRIGEDGGDGLPRRPAHRLGRPAGREHQIAGLQRLDRRLAARSGKPV